MSLCFIAASLSVGPRIRCGLWWTVYHHAFDIRGLRMHSSMAPTFRAFFHAKTTTLLAHPSPPELETLNTAGTGQPRALHCERYIRSRFTGIVTRDPYASTSEDKSLEKHIMGVVECVVVLGGAENDLRTMIIVNKPTQAPRSPSQKAIGSSLE